MPPDQLVFLHVPKTAGTSMRLFLWEIFGRNRVFWHGEDGFLEDVFRLRGPDYFKRFAVVGGHIQFSHAHLALLPGRKVFAAVMRRPLDQVVSHFEYIANRPSHPLYSGLTLEEALASQSRFAEASRNMQCRYISNCSTAAGAVKVLERTPFMLGCFDRLDLLVEHIGATFNVTTPMFPVENAQPVGYFNKHCTPRAAELIADITREDEILYQRLRKKGLLIGGVPTPRSLGRRLWDRLLGYQQ